MRAKPFRPISDSPFANGLRSAFIHIQDQDDREGGRIILDLRKSKRTLWASRIDPPISLERTDEDEFVGGIGIVRFSRDEQGVVKSFGITDEDTNFKPLIFTRMK